MKIQDGRSDQPPRLRIRVKRFALFLTKFLGTLVLTLAALMALMMALMYPVQRNYYRGVYVQESLKHATRLASAIQDYHQTNQHYPQNLEDLHGTADRPIEVRSLFFDGQTGVIRVHVANAPQDEDTFELVPSLESSGRITHSCQSVNISDKFLPQDCTKVGAK